MVFPLGKEISRHCLVAQFAGSAHWAEPSPLKCKNKYSVLALREETTVQALIGSFVSEFRRLKKPRSREMSARGYVLHITYVPKNFFPYGERDKVFALI